jgi:hypothetical protein
MRSAKCASAKAGAEALRGNPTCARAALAADGYEGWEGRAEQIEVRRTDLGRAHVIGSCCARLPPTPRRQCRDVSLRSTRTRHAQRSRPAELPDQGASVAAKRTSTQSITKKAPKGARKNQPLIIESDIPHFDRVARWEHELLLPLVRSVLDDLMLANDAETDDE